MSNPSASTRFDRAISLVLTFAVVVFTATHVYRAFAAPAGPARVAALTFEEEWTELLDVGNRSEGSTAQINLIEFGDFECPFCQRFDSVARGLQERYGKRVSRTFIHLPIPGHRFARHAAKMAECAGLQGRFWPMHDALFARQDSFGLRPWSAYVGDAGVPDLPSFETCVSNSAKVDRIENGVRAARKFQVTGTPTVFVNGWRFAATPQDSHLVSVIDQILSGRKRIELAGQRFAIQ